MLAGVVGYSVPAAARANDRTACDAAGAQAEAASQLLPGLLWAIGRVESGRIDPGSRRVAPWPWTINAAGKGRKFSDRETALAATRVLLDQGIGSIDIGCFQVNLAYHPEAFDTLETAFDPPANARAAANFLTALRGRTGSWDGAIAAYHSATPERGNPYRLRVLAQLGQGGGQRVTGPASLDEVSAPMLREISWFPISGGVQVWKPNSQNAAPNIISIKFVHALPSVHTTTNNRP